MTQGALHSRESLSGDEKTVVTDSTNGEARAASRYNFAANDPYDRSAPIQMVLPQAMPSLAFMASIRSYQVSSDALAIWYLGQNGFLLKDASGLLIGIDLYLSDSCAITYADLPFRLNRQLPVFIEPEDLDVDVFVTTHSHQDHADPETLRRLVKNDVTDFFGPWESIQRYLECGVPQGRCRLIHPNEEVLLAGSTRLRGAFALPTDDTDLNHMGLVLKFANGTTFYNTGDTGHCELLQSLVPHGVDICAVCINGGFRNLDAMRAAELVKAIEPRVAIPCHYDMMVNNTGNPWMFRSSLDVVGSTARCVIMPYYEPWLYRRFAVPL